jgi:hypothetical protein
MTSYNAVKVFSATKARDREALGERVTEFLRSAPKSTTVVDQKVRQSSDHEFHCISIILFLQDEEGGAGGAKRNTRSTVRADRPRRSRPSRKRTV